MEPYLDVSDRVHKEDYLESVLSAFTYENILTCIPATFTIHTVAGRTSQVGEDMRWTLDEKIALVDANPHALPFSYVLKTEMLQTYLAINQSAFIDLGTASCSFDSDDFKKVLEKVNHFPLEYDGLSEGSRIAAGEILLYKVDIGSPDGITIAPQMFSGDDITYVGFPTIDVSAGCMLQQHRILMESYI